MLIEPPADAFARRSPEFAQRGVKLMGLSVDPVDKHSKWSEDIKETQGAAPNYPMIGDTDFNVSKLYDMLPASTAGDVATRTAADNMTVRNVFIIGPDKKIKLVLVYPMTTGRNFQEILRVIDGQRPRDARAIKLPQNCPVCGAGIVQAEDEVAAALAELRVVARGLFRRNWRTKVWKRRWSRSASRPRIQ